MVLNKMISKLNSFFLIQFVTVQHGIQPSLAEAGDKAFPGFYVNRWFPWVSF